MISTWISAAVVAALASAFAGSEAGQAKPGATPGAAAVVASAAGGAEAGARPSAPAATVTISGPGLVRPNDTCRWFSYVDGLTSVGFAVHDWSGGTPSVVADNEYQAYSSSNFTVTVSIYNGSGEFVGTASKNVSVNANATPCMF